MKNQNLSVCVFGLGKLGLPLAMQFALSGIEVWGFDIDAFKIKRLGDGAADFEEPGLTDHLGELIEDAKFNPTTDVSKALTSVSHIVIVVPLDIGLDKKPDFAKMDTACVEISKNLKSGQTVIVETTVPVGTLRKRIAPLLESGSGLVAGKDFHLAFSPERVSSGTMKMGFSTYPKLVGGLTIPCAENAARLYREGFKFHPNPLIQREVGVWIMGSTEAAEFAKLAETTYRDVNLALANTFALASMKHGIDYLEVVEACNSQPFSQLHNPGIAIGGHCIPVYPHLFLESNDGLGLIESARSINDAMPSRMVELAQSVSEARAGSKALIIGLCYRTGVRESAHSGAFQLREALTAIGLEVELVDELFRDDEIEAMGFVPRRTESVFEHVFINSGDEGFVESVVSQMPDTALVVDGRRTLKSKSNQVRITL